MLTNEKCNAKYLHSKAFGGNALGVFSTLKVFHLVVGCGDPSSDLQVRLMLCPYSGCPLMVQTGGEGGAKTKKTKNKMCKRMIQNVC